MIKHASNVGVVVVAQLVERSLLLPEVRGSNPLISKNNIYFMTTVTFQYNFVFGHGSTFARLVSAPKRRPQAFKDFWAKRSTPVTGRGLIREEQSRVQVCLAGGHASPFDTISRKKPV